MTTTRKSATSKASQPGWLTMQQAAEYVGYSTKEIQRASNDPEAEVPLRSMTVSTNGHKRYRPEWLDEWIEAKAALVEAKRAAS